MALTHSTQMAQLVGNAGGAVQNLPTVSQVGGRERVFIANIALASQASGSQISVARLPIGAIITGIQLLTDTSLSTAQIAMGDVHSGNTAIYAAAQTLTSTNTPTRIGAAATHGTPISTGYDCVSGAVAPYEDVVITTSVAALPASGNLVVIIEYSHD